MLAVGAAAFFAGRLLSKPEPWTAPDFHRLTYRRGVIWSARMMPDASTLLYSAVWDGGPKRIYSTRRDSPDSAPLPYVDADVAAISSKGELALIANRVFINGYAQPGTLQRATLGGASRDILENVQDAEWLPDGSNLAVTHYVDSKFRLEFPIGKVVYETSGWITDPRISPRRQVDRLSRSSGPWRRSWRGGDHRCVWKDAQDLRRLREHARPGVVAKGGRDLVHVRAKRIVAQP